MPRIDSRTLIRPTSAAGISTAPRIIRTAGRGWIRGYRLIHHSVPTQTKTETCSSSLTTPAEPSAWPVTSKVVGRKVQIALITLSSSSTLKYSARSAGTCKPASAAHSHAAIAPAMMNRIARAQLGK
jgi:hypothetical protein